MLSALSFKLINGCYQNASSRNDSDVDFLLEENVSWDDYGFRTSFFLHATKKLTKDKTIALGAISIMDIDRAHDFNHVVLLTNQLEMGKIFSELPQNFCSLSTSINLYKQLNRYLSPDQRREFERSFHLILDRESPYYQKVFNTECFNKSLLRDTNIDDYALVFGKEKLRDTGCQYDLRSKGIKFKYESCDDEISLLFSPLRELENKESEVVFPNGIVAFIGKNGSGKSTLLYRLALELYTSANNRKMQIVPEDIVVSQLILFSYSPFDDFILPNQSDVQLLERWNKSFKNFKKTQNEAYKPRFIYCGIRDVEREVEELNNALELEPDKPILDGCGCNKDKNRLNKTFHQNMTKLSDECRIAFKAAYSLGGENAADWTTFIRNLKEFAPELKTDLKSLINNRDFYEKDWDETFKKLSTGHKFFLHAMTHLIAYCEENAVIMFDEPENHLQAPLLSFMMKEMRRVLARRSSVMLVATHSPIILQETLSSNVRIVRRSGEKVFIQEPRIETFGASFDSISSEVFDLTVDKVSYFDVIGKIYEQENCSTKKSIDDVLRLMKDRMGKLSISAVHYIVQLYYSEKDGGADVGIA